MATCKQCGRDIEQVEGKVAKQYCSAACKQAFHRATRNRQPVTWQPVTVGRQVPDEVGPLDVYSEHRWAFLQSRGHVWEGHRSTRPGPHGSTIIGVTVPGDPAYEGVAA
ncbi:MAG TPA: hypothetical protein HPP87_07315 [Planctomycetes bacterium]|nr:hypothetical protein [Planctomycetota bacterium]